MVRNRLFVIVFISYIELKGMSTSIWEGRFFDVKRGSSYAKERLSLNREECLFKSMRKDIQFEKICSIVAPRRL